mmetsp:Transcript_45140/g.130683  ORF Transcript_45140/g.130683 Transcript_45140/m.130683 type:complete len:204 (+) Transcript_45140:919-1530(+)
MFLLTAEPVHVEVLSLLVILQPEFGKISHELHLVSILLDLALLIKEDHVARRDRGPKLQCLLQPLILQSLHLIRDAIEAEVHIVLSVVLPEVIDSPPSAVISCFDQLCEELLVVLCPTLHRQLRDLNCVRPCAGSSTHDFIATAISVVILHDAALEALVPRTQSLIRKGLLLDEAPQEVHEVPGVVVWQRRRPPSANALRTVH